MKKQQKNEPSFLKDLRSALEIKHFTQRTKETYVCWITCNHAFLKSHRDLYTVPSTQKVEAFLSDMAPNVAAATQNQAFNAFLFFYRNVISTELGDTHSLRAKKKVRVRVVLSKEETRQLLSCLTSYVALICRLMYGSGLRFTGRLPCFIPMHIGYTACTIREQFGNRYAETACNERSELYADFGID